MTQAERASAVGGARAPVVKLRDVTFAYQGAPVLEDVSLCVERGDFACCVGPNGGGKSTLLKIVLGLLTPQSGSVEVLGGRPEAARPRLGYMPQHARLDPQFPATALDVALMGRLSAAWRLGPFGRKDRDVAEACLREVGLADLRKRPYAAISGGQQKRVLIARALACEPELLLLDEPAANLDLQAEQQLYELLHSLSRRLTILAVSHDMAFVSKHVRTAICVNRRVHTHRGNELTDEVIQRLYGREVRLVQHHGGAGHVHGPDCHHVKSDAGGA